MWESLFRIRKMIMKIISKHTDYYDGMVSVYGRDEHLVYDRRSPHIQHRSKTDNQTNLFAICGQLYRVLHHEGKPYWSVEDLTTLYGLIDQREMGWWFRHVPWGMNSLESFQRSAKSEFAYYNKPTDINLQRRQPVLIKVTGETGWEIPILSEFGFGNIVEAGEMYQKIVAFLGILKDSPPIPNNQCDLEKVVSHGFDRKRSFRPKMK